MKKLSIPLLGFALALGAGPGTRAAEVPRFWLSGDLLATTSQKGEMSDVRVAHNTGGYTPVLGEPGVTLLYDNEKQDYGVRPGLSLTAGAWLDAQATWGLEGSLVWEKRKECSWGYAEDAATGVSSALLYGDGTSGWWVLNGGAVVGSGYGSLQITASSQTMGLDALAVRNLERGATSSLDFLLGLKYFSLEEDFGIALVNAYDPGDSPAGIYAARDTYKAQNRILALKLGLRAEGALTKRLRVSLESDLALGINRQAITVDGTALFYDTTYHHGGAFTGPAILGKHDKNQAVFLPELKLGLGYALTDALSLQLKGQAMYVSSVVRGSDQVDSTSPWGDTGLAMPIPSATSTELTVPFRQRGYFSYGVSLGAKMVF